MKPKNIKTIKSNEFKAWAILDIQKKTPRLCYASQSDKNNSDSAGAVAITFKKPFIPLNWRPFKKIVHCVITIKDSK